MANLTKAQLEERIEKLKAQLEQASRPPDVQVLTIAYDPAGRLVAATRSGGLSARALRATKTALADVMQQVDMLLLSAVEQEARAWALAKDPPEGE